MTDGTPANRRTSTDGRFESLQSLHRLLETDMRDILRQNSRLLPVLQIGGVGLAARRRTLADHMHDLTAARSKVIHGLLPSLDQIVHGTRRHGDYKHDSCRPKNRQSTEKNKENAKSDVITETKSIQVDVDGDDSECEDTTSEVVNDEYGYCHRASIRSDDFQHFLGVRYLQICHKRKLSDESEDDSGKHMNSEGGVCGNSEMKPTPVSPTSKSPNVRLLALSKARRRNLQNKQRKSVLDNNNFKLPPIFPVKGKAYVDRGHCQQKATRSSGPGCLAPCSIGLQSLRRGIPGHTETRAQLRYTGRLQALLRKFRDTCNTMQKVEQENIVEELDET